MKCPRGRNPIDQSGQCIPFADFYFVLGRRCSPRGGMPSTIGPRSTSAAPMLAGSRLTVQDERWLSPTKRLEDYFILHYGLQYYVVYCGVLCAAFIIYYKCILQPLFYNMHQCASSNRKAPYGTRYKIAENCSKR